MHLCPPGLRHGPHRGWALTECFLQEGKLLVPSPAQAEADYDPMENEPELELTDAAAIPRDKFMASSRRLGANQRRGS